MQNNNIALGIQALRQAQQAQAGKRYPEAIAAYNRALALTPASPPLLVAFAGLCEEVGDLAAARTLYTRLGALRPDCGFEGMIGQTYLRERHYDNAAAWFRKADTRSPDNPDILVNLAAALAHGRRVPEAVTAYQRAYAARHDVETLRKLLAVQISAGDVAGADATVHTGLAAHPESTTFRSMCAEHLLKSGHYGEGFDLFRLRKAGDGAQPGDPIACDWWDGNPLAGTLLVAAEQGLGDEIIASSMYGDLVAAGIHAIIECDPRLLPIFQRSLPGIHFVSRQEGTLVQLARDNPAGCRKIRAIDLCCHFRRDATAFPSRQAWLHADAVRRDALHAEYRERWPGKTLVGFSWKSMRHFHGEDVKSLRPTDLRQLLTMPNAVFICLQYGNVEDDLRAAADAGLPIHRDERINATTDIDGLFAQTAVLDLVVSTSSTTAHIAGAQGVPTRLLLPSAKGVPWYWGYAGQRTPWYPAIQVFRNSDIHSVPALDAALADSLAHFQGAR